MDNKLLLSIYCCDLTCAFTVKCTLYVEVCLVVANSANSSVSRRYILCILAAFVQAADLIISA